MIRRDFIRKSTIAGTSALWVGASSRIWGANDAVVLGMIGTGGRGQRLLKGLSNIPGYRVAAVCDLREDRVNRAREIGQETWPHINTYTDFHKLLEKEKIDACFIATEEGNHAKCVVPVLEAGLHCFSEKPVDITVEKVDLVVKTARKAKGIYQVGFQRRYVPGIRKAIDHVHDGKMGKVTFLQGMWQWTEGVSGRYLDMALSGCWFLAQACHHSDAMMWVMKDQPPLRCAAMGVITDQHENPPAYCAEDHSALMFEFPGGVIYSYTHLMNCCQPFTGEKLWIYTEKGGIDLVTGIKYPRPGMGEPEPIGEKSPDWDYGTYQELEAFAHHIRNHEKPLSNVETARLSTLMSILGWKAMYRWEKKKFEPSLVTWNDLGSTT